MFCCKDVVIGDGRDTFGLLNDPHDLVLVRKVCDAMIMLSVIVMLNKNYL